MSERDDLSAGLHEKDEFQRSSIIKRELSTKEMEMLQKQNKKIVSEFRQNKLETEAKKMWDLFYKRNKTNFFKDRHWTSREFAEIQVKALQTKQLTVLEAGCGVGNAIFPLLELIPNIKIYACDFSPRAIEFVKENKLYNEQCNAFTCDLTSDDLSKTIPENSVDVATLIFVLSAIHPSKFEAVLCNIFKVLKPGGHLLFRDYGINDWAMLRFTNGSKLADNFYVRQDGTRAYYFTLELMQELAEKCGYKVLSNEYVLRETVNKKENVHVPRVFLQTKFIKEISDEN